MVMIQALSSTRSSAPMLMPNGAKASVNYSPQLLLAPLESLSIPCHAAVHMPGAAPGTWCIDSQAGSMNNPSNDGGWPYSRMDENARCVNMQQAVGQVYSAMSEQLFQQGGNQRPMGNGMMCQSDQRSMGNPMMCQSDQRSMGNPMMCQMMYTAPPEQTVILSCDASDDSSLRGSHFLTAQSLESLSTMAALSSQSLPAMPKQKSGRPYAVDSTHSLASLTDRKAKGKKNDKSKGSAAPWIPRSKTGNDSFADRVHQGSLPVPEQALHGKSEKCPATFQPAWPIMNDNDAGNSCQLVKEQLASKTKLAEQPTVDPVMLELEENDLATQRKTLDWVISSVWPLAFTGRGSRILQKALDVGTPRDQLQILLRLEGHIQEAMRSPHGNYVLQKCIEVIPPERVQFFLDELKGSAVMAARHRFGCRILQRLIEHCPLEQTEDMVVEVLSEVASLCRHQFGNFVVQHILQHGSPAHKKRIADALHGEIIRLAKHRIASHVVSCALVNCATEEVQRLTQVVLADAGQLADLSRREYGSFVVREVNRVRRMHG